MLVESKQCTLAFLSQNFLSSTLIERMDVQKGNFCSARVTGLNLCCDVLSSNFSISRFRLRNPSLSLKVLSRKKVLALSLPAPFLSLFFGAFVEAFLPLFVEAFLPLFFGAFLPLFFGVFVTPFLLLGKSLPPLPCKFCPISFLSKTRERFFKSCLLKFPGSFLGISMICFFHFALGSRPTPFRRSIIAVGARPPRKSDIGNTELMTILASGFACMISSTIRKIPITTISSLH
mmetsp:Transcript_19970/g.43428  ORF Transcript_19970/g.43428 Transcript_19970/m.43428 type:complete len:233 (+) Transcript_19970:230-928(+)